MIMEFIWLPVILLSTAFIFPMPFNLVLTVFLGLPGYILFSYGWNSAVPFVVENDGPPYYFVFFCLPVTLLTLFLGIMNYFLFRMADRIKTLELINERINILNRETMRKVFILQNIAKGEERKRISKEVHDTAGYVFVNLIMMLQAAQAVFTKDAKKTEQLIAETRNYAERGINEIRHILRDIRDYNQVSMGIQNDIHDIAFSFQKATGVIVEINYGGWPKNLGKDLDSFFLSLTQESLTNALKHGHASTVSIQCWLENRKITMSITDNGSGAILPVQKGIGISSIEEYVREHNGEVLIQSSHGFHLVVSIPLSP
jgi:signal transduction histidine kinase